MKKAWLAAIAVAGALALASSSSFFGCAPRSTGPADKHTTSQPDISKLVTDLSSGDGNVRVAATKAIFDLAEKSLDPLKAAGAKQISPSGTVDTSRLDIVYSLLDGLKENPPGIHAGYAKAGFGLRVEAGCTLDDVKKMGQKHGFEVAGQFTADGVPNCYVTLKAGKTLADVLRAVLTGEPKVVSTNLNYVES